jgi:hypothetical protein
MRALFALLAGINCGTLFAAPFFEIQVVDDRTGRGVPCVELRTVNHTRYFTDSAGRVAYAEPGHSNRTVFFWTRSDGYEFPKDGFGQAGVRLEVVPGGRAEIKARRLNLAERLYRTTGEGIYRDTVLLGHDVPIAQPLLNADIAGQDSIQRAIIGQTVFWFWGDTTRLSYPLGNFRMSGAVSDLPSLDPARGMNYRYFTNAGGGPKGMFPIPPDGDLIWSDGHLVVTNHGRAAMLARFQRLKSLDKPLAQGLAIYNAQREEFELLHSIELAEKWRFPHGHPVLHDGYFLFGLNFPNVRVSGRYDAITNSSAYRAWSCLDGENVVPYRWTRDAPPTGPKEEKRLVDQGKLSIEKTHFLPRDVESGRVILMHTGTVNWNEWRKKWIAITVEIGGRSMLGEVWYSEADQPTGPWRATRKIVTHDKYSFYNPAHHPFLDQEGGRMIYFEGTYTLEFSGGKEHTPRYDYNQIMYRLDLAEAKLN